MVGNVTIQGQITGAATFDGAKISAVVTIAPPINATVNFGGGISTVEQLPAPVSDSSNIYTWIRDTLLTGLAELSYAAITTTDTILQGFSKLQGQLNAVKVRLGLLEDDLIYEVLTTSAVASVIISVDKNGQPFILSECVLYVMNPSWPSNMLHIRVNNNTLAIYNSYAYASTTRFQVVIGELGGQAKLNLKYDPDVKTVVINGHNSRIYAGPTFAAYFTNGFTNYGAITTPISRVDVLPNTGLIPVGTKIILKKK